MASPWNPACYDLFADERRQPFFDLLALVAPCPGGLACSSRSPRQLLAAR